MSKEAVLNFIIKVNQDKELLEKISALPSSRVEALVDLARQNGFTFTIDEFISTVLAQRKFEGELQDEQLEHVSAGAVDSFNQAIPSPINPGSVDLFNKFLPSRP